LNLACKSLLKPFGAEKKTKDSGNVDEGASLEEDALSDGDDLLDLADVSDSGDDSEQDDEEEEDEFERLSETAKENLLIEMEDVRTVISNV